MSTNKNAGLGRNYLYNSILSFSA